MANAEAYKTEIKRTFALVQPISTQAAAIFYPTLWEVNPATKPLFKNTDMDKQGEKLMKTLGIAVAMLNKMDTLVPILQHLGRKHVSYGVKAEMYSSVREALLITLEKGLGGECTAETKEAWTWVLGVISGVCIEAAKEVDPEYAAAPVATVTPEADPVTAPAGEPEKETQLGCAKEKCTTSSSSLSPIRPTSAKV